jgi:transposase-like protein
MSKPSNNFTPEEKAAIALKAVSGDDHTKQELAKEHNVTVEQIDQWIRETGVKPVTDSNDTVELEANEDFAESVEFGAVPDRLNYPRLTFWSIFGTVVIVMMVLAIMAIYEYTSTSAQQARSAESEFYELRELQQRDQSTLDSFGVVDPEQGIYRIPIDSAITIIAQDSDD